MITLALTIGSVLAKPKIVADLNGRLKPVWSDVGPTYPLAAQFSAPEGETAAVIPPPGPAG